MRMSGLPAALVAGHPYTVALEPTGAGELGNAPRDDQRVRPHRPGLVGDL